MKKIGIYKITSPSGKVYIGQSIDIDNRFKQYKSHYCKKQYVLYNSLKKYGFDNHKFEIITLCDVSQLNDLERYYQDLYCVLGDNGMNLRLTETNDRFGKLSDELKEKISKNRKGKYYLTENDKKHLSIINKGKIFSKETCNKISESKKGCIFSEEHRIKLSKAKKGRKFSEETRKKMSLAQKNRKQKLNLSLQYGEQTEKSGQEGI